MTTRAPVTKAARPTRIRRNRPTERCCNLSRIGSEELPGRCCRIANFTKAHAGSHASISLMNFQLSELLKGKHRTALWHAAARQPGARACQRNQTPPCARRLKKCGNFVLSSRHEDFIREARVSRCVGKIAGRNGHSKSVRFYQLHGLILVLQEQSQWSPAGRRDVNGHRRQTT